jgi:hypothetical protein
MCGSEVSLMSGPMFPGAVVANEDVGEDELAHDRDERDLGGLAPGAEAIVDGLEVGVEARGRRQVERAAEITAPAADPRLALPPSGLARAGREGR